MFDNYAFIKNGVVENLIVCDNPSQELLDMFKTVYEVDLVIKGTEKAIVGGEYDGEKFWLPQPYPSWIKNEELNEWEAPIPSPASSEEDLQYYKWNEETLNWEEIQVPE